MNRRTFLGGMAASLAAAAQTPLRKYNVLFIAVDDMKPTLGCYGDSLASTPNLDRLAAKSLRFTRAYCQQAVCSPTRTSLLLGRRPDTTKIYDLEHHFRGVAPDVVTLPELFKQNGYVTTGLGKIWHGGLEDGRSNTIAHWVPGSPAAWGTAENAVWQARREAAVITDGWRTDTAAQRERRTGKKIDRGPVWAAPDVADDALADGKTAAMALQAMRTLKDDRFFLMTGFLKPHLPLVAPKKYFDRHAAEKFTPAPNQQAPAGTPEFALHVNGELRTYGGVPPKGPIPDALQRELLRAYYACVSYTDAQIGRLLDGLKASGLEESTIVIVWGDHGWHLGDHGLWHKHTNFEQATRVPLLIHVPGQANPGAASAALTEFVDIYPTLAELCGLKPPAGLEGTSFVPLFATPNKPWKRAAFSQYPRTRKMGYSMRTERYRLTLWLREGDRFEEAAELYDYEVDPGEKRNLATSPEHAEVLRTLREQFAAGWRGAQPR